MFEWILVSIGIGIIVGIGLAHVVTHKQIHQIHFCEGKDLEKELKKFNIDLVKNEQCIVCNDEIIPDNIGMIVKREGKYYEICNKNRCMTIYDTIES